MQWAIEHVAEHLPGAPVLIMGDSAGGGLAAAAAVACRERGIGPIAAQMLVYPMLDDRTAHALPAAEPFLTWSVGDNVTGWGAYLGDLYGTDGVPAAAAAARTEDVTGLPPPTSRSANSTCSVRRPSPTQRVCWRAPFRSNSSFAQARSTATTSSQGSRTRHGRRSRIASRSSADSEQTTFAASPRRDVEGILSLYPDEMVIDARRESRRPRRDAVRNRERIVVAARDAFAAGGVDASLELIAKNAGVAIGTLYRHFPRRIDLILAALDEKFRAFLDATEQALVAEDPWTGLSQYLEKLCGMQADDRGFNDFVSMRFPANPQTEALHDRVCDAMARILARAQEAGAVREEITLGDLIAVTWANTRIHRGDE